MKESRGANSYTSSPASMPYCTYSMPSRRVKRQASSVYSFCAMYFFEELVLERASVFVGAEAGELAHSPELAAEQVGVPVSGTMYSMG